MTKRSTPPNEQPAEAGSTLGWIKDALERYNPRIWAERHILNERGKPLEFSDRPWLKQIYDDPHPRIVAQKPAQVGITTWGLVRALHQVAMHAKTAIFTMPTQDDARIFVTGRVNRMIDSSPMLRQLTQKSGKQQGHRPADSAEIKHVGEGTIYFRGTMREGAALSIPADVLFHDEVDRSDPETLEMYAHRLDALQFEQRQIYQFSTPTVPNFGISALYEASDSRQWLVRCLTPGCKWQGPLDYWEHTDGQLLYLRCTGCGKALNPLNGEWVAAHPERSSATHGYLVSRLFMALPDQPGELQGLHAARTSAYFQRHFFNMVLGMPSTEGTTSITREQILGSCFTETYDMLSAPEYTTGPYFMGVDQGDTLTVLIGRLDPYRDGGRIRIVYMVRLRDPSRGSGTWTHVAELMNLFQIRMCVVDGQPNSANAHDLARDFPGRVLNCYYTERPKTEISLAADVTRRATAAPSYNDNQPLPSTSRTDITVNRTETLDRTAADLVQGKFLLPSPPSLPDVIEFMRHCENNVRRPVEGKDGVPINRWERTGPNDYFHALNYLRLAAEQGDHLSQLGPTLYAPAISILGARPGSMKRRGSSKHPLQHYGFQSDGSWALPGSRPKVEPEPPPGPSRDRRWWK